MLVQDIGEFGLIRRLQTICQRYPFASPAPLSSDPEAPFLRPHEAKSGRLLLGIGDDAAVWRPPKGRDLVLTCDAQVEGRHFLPLAEMSPSLWPSIGRRCAMVNLSDLAAMGAFPRLALVSLGLPSRVHVEAIEAIYEGLTDAFAAFQTPVVGGNVTRTTDELWLDITLLGDVAAGQSVRRSTAKVGDLLGVTGFPGSSFAGLRLLLERGELSILSVLDGPYRSLADAYLRPSARIVEAQSIAPFLSSMIDISDGLLSEIDHLLESGKKGAVLWKAALPISDVMRAWADETDCDPFSLLFGASDDYELLFSAPPSVLSDLETSFRSVSPLPLSWIGEITDDPGLFLQDREGLRSPLLPQGWRHF